MTKLQWLMKVAYAVEAGSTYHWTKVGCVAINRYHKIISTGYNGYPPGLDLDISDRDEALRYAIHAEVNCMSELQAGTVYAIVTTVMPCPDCINLLVACRVQKVFYDRLYERRFAECKDLIERYADKIKMIHYTTYPKATDD